MPSNDTSATGGGLLSLTRRLVALLILVSLPVLFLGGQAHAQDAEEPVTTEEPSAEDEARDEQLREGATVYTQICASCHQAGGIGLEGQFPPLINNEHVDDAEYLETVITNGRQGEIVVSGVTYNGVMPSFSTLSDDDTSAVIAFIQNDFIAPATSAVVNVGPVAGTELPALTNMTYVLTFVMVAALIAMVLAPRVLSETDRIDMPWLDAWLKTAVIVSSVIILTVLVPDWAVKNSYVTELSRFAQDLIGVSLWMAGMGAVFWSLWYAHRRSRI